MNILKTVKKYGNISYSNLLTIYTRDMKSSITMIKYEFIFIEI